MLAKPVKNLNTLVFIFIQTVLLVSSVWFFFLQEFKYSTKYVMWAWNYTYKHSDILLTTILSDVLDLGGVGNNWYINNVYILIQSQEHQCYLTAMTA